MYKRWRKTGREGERDREKKKNQRGIKPILRAFHVHPPSSFFHLCPHFFQSYSVSVTLFFSITPLPFALLSLPLSFLLQVCPSVSTPPSISFFSHPSLKPSLSIPALALLLQFTPSLLPFLCLSSTLHHPSISCFSLPFFPNTLLSHYLSPSIVVVVDYVIRAEDMSFLSTRFSAQHDYTKPLSTVSISLTQTHIQAHKQGFLNMQVIDMD